MVDLIFIGGAFIILLALSFALGAKASISALAKGAEKMLADIHAVDGDGKLELSDLVGYLRSMKFLQIWAVIRGKTSG